MSEVLETYSLVDISDLKNDLGIKDETGFDDLLTRIANGVTAAIERMCKRKFVARSVTESLDGSGTSIMYVRAPIISITSITNDGVLLASADYKWYARTGKIVLVGASSGSRLLRTGGHFDTDPQSVVIVYRHGYDEQDMPQDILLAARMWAIHWYQRVNDDRIGVGSRSESDFSISFRDEAVPPEIQRLIQPMIRMGRVRSR